MRKLKIGLVGHGLVFRSFLISGIRNTELVEIAAVCGRNESKVRLFAGEMCIPKWYTNYEAMLKDKEIDAVLIGTPNFLHYSQVLSAADAGKHILCEKPMALNMTEAEKMVNVCDKKGITFMIAHHLRYKACNQRIKKILNEQKLGKISSCRVQWSFNRTASNRKKDWHTVKNLSGGGQFVNVNSHCIDLLVYLFGSANKVSAFMHYEKNKELEDGGIVLIEFANNILTIAEGFYNEKSTQNNLEIFGNNESIIVQNACTTDKHGIIKLLSENRLVTDIKEVNPYTSEIEHFVRCIAGNKEPLSSGRNVLKTMHILMAAYQSAEIGKHIEL